MALGRARLVPNLRRTHHAEAEDYVFIKVQHGAGHEEYLLVTPSEFSRAQGAFRRLFPTVNTATGTVEMHSTSDSFHSDQPWYVTHVSAPWLQGEVGIAIYDLERIRTRVTRNAEDIQANRESWLADLLD